MTSSKGNIEITPDMIEAEIEVTPEMVRRGIRELAYFDPREDPPEFWEEIVENIYRVMAAARENGL